VANQAEPKAIEIYVGAHEGRGDIRVRVARRPKRHGGHLALGAISPADPSCPLNPGREVARRSH
jgi:hypothetical protein